MEQRPLKSATETVRQRANGRRESEARDASQPIVETRGLSKCYGPFAALDDCTLAVQPDEIFGLLGPNGAGKTTLLRLLLGMLGPSRGAAYIFGLDCQRESLRIRRDTSYLPGEARLFRGMRARDLARFFAELRGVHMARVQQVADRLQLDLAPRVGAMSTGMRQKLALAITLAADCRLLILDEPTSNLDPTVRATVIELVKEARSAGTTVVFSSHVLAEVEEACDRVAILRAGRLVHVQQMQPLRQRHYISARCAGPLPTPPAEFAQQLQVHRDGRQHLVIEANGQLGPVLGWLATLPLDDVRIEPVGLRAIYERIQSLDSGEASSLKDSEE